MKPLIQDLVMFIISNRTDLGIPQTVRMDKLMGEGDSISVAMRGVPKAYITYVNGSRKLRANFDVLGITEEGANDAKSLQVVKWLEAIGATFEGMNNFALSSERTILSASQVTMPTIVGRSDDGRISYVMNVTIDYKEKAK